MSSYPNKNETLMIRKNAVESRRSVVDYIDNECCTATSSSPFQILYLIFHGRGCIG